MNRTKAAVSPLTLHRRLRVNEEAFGLVGDEGAFLGLEEDGAALQALDGVPDALGDIHSVPALAGIQNHAFKQSTVVIVSADPDTPPEHDQCLILGRMVVDGYLSAGLQSIQEPVALLIQALVEVVVHPQPRRLLRLGGQRVKELRINYH